MDDSVKRYLRKLGRKGGKARSREKLAAVSKNLAKARAARWPRKGGRP